MGLGSEHASRYAAGTAAMILRQAYLGPKFFWRSLFGSFWEDLIWGMGGANLGPKFFFEELIWVISRLNFEKGSQHLLDP